ncbi:MAG: LytTR family DNA-binding domain-containing protein [Thermoanaerobaculia bacterium]
MPLDRVLLHLPTRHRRPIPPADVYYLEAHGNRTLIRLRDATPLEDVRSLGELHPLFAPHAFHRIHRNHSVNLRRILEIRPREEGFDWEVKMEPPVNRVLPVARGLEGLLGCQEKPRASRVELLP